MNYSEGLTFIIFFFSKLPYKEKAPQT